MATDAAKACIASMLDRRPFLFPIAGERVGVAVGGVPMSYRVWVICVLGSIDDSMPMPTESQQDALSRSLMLLHAQVPQREESSSLTPFLRCFYAVTTLHEHLRIVHRSDFKQILMLLRNVEQDCAIMAAEMAAATGARLNTLADTLVVPE